MKVRCTHDRLVDISALRQHPKNRNKHPKDQLERLAQILRYQGFRYPVKVSNLSGFVTSGHGRIEAAKLNGWKQVPVNYQDYDDETQEYADVQADNAIASWSELDLSGINTDVVDLGPDFDIDLLGIKDFVLEPADKLEPQCDEDEVPEHVEPKTKLGDIYQLGRHRLMCGDSTSIDAIDKLMSGNKAEMVFTDPPYGMSLDTDYSSMKGWAQGKKYKQVAGDNDDFRPELIQTMLGVFTYCAEVVLWGADYYAELLPDKNKGSWAVWDKRVDEAKDSMYGSCFELCWSKNKHKRLIFRKMWAGFMGDVEARNRVHPTQKPTELITQIFDEWAKDLTNIVDLFGGSGSTLIACEKTNRKCFMMELDPHYCDVIVARWEKYTGQKAELING